MSQKISIKLQFLMSASIIVSIIIRNTKASFLLEEKSQVIFRSGTVLFEVGMRQLVNLY